MDIKDMDNENISINLLDKIILTKLGMFSNDNDLEADENVIDFGFYTELDDFVCNIDDGKLREFAQMVRSNNTLKLERIECLTRMKNLGQ